MVREIYDWQDIASRYENGSILLGNGASIAISGDFNYKNLKDKACRAGLMIDSVNDLFKNFKTDDFELVLRLVWQANTVNKILKVPDGTIAEEAYQNIRDCLIQTIQQNHPSYDSVIDKFEKMHKFSSQFKTLISLNYDLLIYWMMMWGNNKNKNNGRMHTYKDCFNGYGQFNQNWESCRTLDRAWSNTLVFYPHGNLILTRDIEEYEFKVKGGGVEANLLASIFRVWNDGESVPIFVSEGETKQKETAIHNSSYLSTVYHEVIPKMKESLTIYGWGFGEQDDHILKQILKSNVNRIAISVFENNQDYCDHVTKRIAKMCQAVNKDFNNIKLEFFHSDSSGCWIY
ncbi:DUF4917 family protein [Vitreoscilla stercoraria]|uniref:DUF4917 family protein n=1 Tax=Vitreoscilla stercoraria TaxID=61 RepID=A0ABY4E7Z8_VITST|nr:DUF4917 family protein [Vitreoscilla stercoraria]UOO91468.1 DUF4917 family protein [Vitreoscilla stercoraria]